jgi:signal transduction histidine kinase
VYYNFFNEVKLTLIIFFGSAFIFVAQAQDRRVVDSLLRELQTAHDEPRILKVKAQLADELFDIDNQMCLRYADEAYQLATHLGDSTRLVRMARMKGQMLRRLDRLQESIDILTEVLPIARRNNLREDYKKILNALAIVHTFQADYDKALEYHFQSLVVRQEEGNKAEISITLNNIGLVYFKLRNYEAALKYYEECLALKKENGITYDLDALYINMGLCYGKLHRYIEARESVEQAFATCDGKCSDIIRISGEYGLGISDFWLRNLPEADKHLNISLAIARRVGDKLYQGENLTVMAEIAADLNDNATAEKLLMEAEGIITELGYNELLMNIYLQFSHLYTKTENFEQASKYQTRYIHLKDSLVSEELVKSIAKIQTNFAERENIATIASKEEAIKQQRDLNAAVVVIAVLAGLLILVLQFGNRNIKRVNAKLSEAKEVIQKQNAELEIKNRQLDNEVDKKTLDLARVNQSLKQVNDELDNFIYKTSHDIRGPLASLKGMCNVALMDVKDPVALDYLKKLDATAERLNSILTRLVIINQINNSKITTEKIDFNVIVNDVLMLEKKKGLPQELQINTFIDAEVQIESDKELVRIVLENLIDNAIKFYNDSDRIQSFIHIHIANGDNGSVRVRVIDNGIGISESSPGKLFQMFSRASERSETGGIGLYITKTATEKIGGKVGLLTTPEGYTEFYVIFPPVPSSAWDRTFSHLL